MRRYGLVRNLLALLIIVGVALAPLTPRAGAQAMADPAAAMADADMAGDMPCCPTSADLPMDCGKCVSMATCGGVSPTALPENFVTLPTVFTFVQMIAPIDDLLCAGLTHPPPAKPPRSLTSAA